MNYKVSKILLFIIPCPINRDERSPWRAVTICIQPHIKKRITPQKLLPLPWDNPRKERKDSKPRRTMPISRKRLDIVTKRFGS